MELMFSKMQNRDGMDCFKFQNMLVTDRYLGGISSAIGTCS